MYIKENDDGSFIHPYTIEQLRAECGKLLPKNMTKAQLESLGVYSPNFEPVDFDSKTQKVDHLAPEKINGAWVVKSVVTDKTAEDYGRENLIRLKSKESEIKAAYLLAEAVDVTDLNGVTWRGGIESASAINGAISLANARGDTTVKMRDTNKAEHVLTLADAMAVALLVGSYAEAEFHKKESKLEYLRSLDLTQATTGQLILETVY